MNYRTITPKQAHDLMSQDKEYVYVVSREGPAECLATLRTAGTEQIGLFAGQR